MQMAMSMERMVGTFYGVKAVCKAGAKSNTA